MGEPYKTDQDNVWATELSDPVPTSVHACDRFSGPLLCLLLHSQTFFIFNWM